ncbi:hypothetical protein BpHYR1_050693 [Brachionus plicatilis]|uniref:DUF229 domain containing n=1 Tax=Brachionus plicatilis TaxID=10195 RepID=A0A3M7P3S3_BRAPC|nr:hypothetical protein BpHYR1_050693 [Brachionus plicatilis]
MKKLIKKSILNKFLRTFALFINILSKLKRTGSKKPLVRYKINGTRGPKRHKTTDNQIKCQNKEEAKTEPPLSKVYCQYISQDGKIYSLSPHRTKVYHTDQQSAFFGPIRFKAILMLFIFILAYVGLNNYLIMFVYYGSQNLKSNHLSEKNKIFFPFVSLLSDQTNKIGKVNKSEDKILSENFTILIDPLDLDYRGIEKNASSTKLVFLPESYFQPNSHCVLPKLDPYEKDLMQFVKKEPDIICNPKQNWIYVQNGTIRVSKAAMQKHGVIVCAYIPLYRGNNDFTVYEGSRIFPVMDKMPLISDFFKIDCRSKDGAIYSNIHSGIAYDSSLHIRHMWNPLPKRALGYNVLMFGFDSVSRMSWIRMLPKSYAYMIQEGFVVLKGYNIVGDGTPQALLPILTGKKETELPEARRGFVNATHVDDFPWIWQDFKNAGYVTQWAEDMQSIGTFQLRMLGFKRQPVDHYMRLFYLEAEKYYARFRKLCLGSLSRHQNMINWVKEFFSVYDSKPKFSFVFHSEASHNHNNPLSLLDDDLKRFLQHLKLSGVMQNTVLLFMSDHGVRVSDIRKYSQGKLEEVCW